MTLLQKIDRVLEQFNDGKDNSYSLGMKDLIETAKYDPDEYTIEERCVYENGSYEDGFHISVLIGECILENNPNMFNE